MTVTELPAPLGELANLQRTASGFKGVSAFSDHGAIFGAHQLFQLVLAAEWTTEAKRVLSLHTVFAGGGRSGQPLDIDVEVMQEGRSFASLTLTLRQQEVLISRSLALMTGDEPDFLRHQSPKPYELAAAQWVETNSGFWPGSADRVEPAEPDRSRLRYRLDTPVTDATVGRALLALVTESTLMSDFINRAGIPGQTGNQVAGNVLTQSLTFLEPIGPDATLIVETTSTYAGRGRTHGLGAVCDAAGLLLATFTSTGVLRAPRVR